MEAMLAPGAVIAGRFVVSAHAGTGGMGAVYRARDETTGVEVALKLIHQLGTGDLARFEREAKVLEHLRHPSISRYVAHGTDAQGVPFLAMEWVEGETLTRRLKGGALSIEDAVALCEGVAGALACAHAAGIVHRDIKPGNVLLREGDARRPSLIDFGVARIGPGVSELTTAGEIVGTPGYMAPEQARGDVALGPAADVFSLGCVLYRCLAGRAPFEGDTLVAVLAKILLDEAPRVRSLRAEVPAYLDALVAEMLTKDPARRPADGAEVARRLEAASEPERVSSPEPMTLTEREQRLVTLVLARPAARPSDDTPTIVDRADAREVVREVGGHLEWLVDGTAVVTLVGKGDAAGQAVLAARCARALAAALPGWSVAVATGLGRLDQGVPMGQVIDRAAALLAVAPLEGDVVVDDVTAGLLDARFDVVVRDGRRILAGERATFRAARTLLGKPAPFVGRERELGMLTDLFDECVAERSARAALIVGPTGVGKSRLRDELVRSLEAPPRVWVGRADPVAARAPLSLLAGAVRRAARVLDNEPAALQREKLEAFASTLDGDAALAADLIAFVGTSAQSPHAGRGDVLAHADRAHRFFEDLLVRAAGAGPVVLVLEDLQWADAQSVAAVDGALRLAADLPLFVLGVARPEVDDVFPRVWAQRGVQPVVLRELGRRSAEKLAREVLGAAATPEVVERIVSRSGGNAFYLEELIRSVAEGGGGADEFPQTVMAMVGVRLDQLDAPLRRLLRAGSVFGGVFWERGVAALLGEDAARVSPNLSALVDRELVTLRSSSRFEGERELVFRHALLREAAYVSLTDVDRTLGHRLAAEWLEQVGEPDAAVLAEHFERANVPLRAAAHWGRAAVSALEGGDLAAALSRAERALRAELPPSERAQALMVAAEVLRWRGEFTEALSVAKRALGSLPTPSALAFDAVGEIAIDAGRTGSAADLSDATALLMAHAPDAEQANAWAIAASRASAYLLFRGDTATADELIRRFEGLGPGLSAGARARIHQTRSIRAQLDGDYEATLRELLLAEERYVGAGDVRGTCNVRMNVAFSLTQMGRYAEAESRLELCLVDAERIGLGAIAAGARGNLVLTLGTRGNVERAGAVAEVALAEFDRQGDGRMATSTCCYLSSALRRAGDREGALKAAERALAYAAGTTYQPMALAVRAQALLASGDVPGALDAATEAKRALDAAGEVEEGDADVRLAWASALGAAGRVDEATAAWNEARARLVARADRIGDAELRRSFLEAIPEHAETMAGH